MNDPMEELRQSRLKGNKVMFPALESKGKRKSAFKVIEAYLVDFKRGAIESDSNRQQAERKGLQSQEEHPRWWKRQEFEKECRFERQEKHQTSTLESLPRRCRLTYFPF